MGDQMKKVRVVGAVVLMGALLFTGVDYAAAAATPDEWSTPVETGLLGQGQ
jgi:hypothetical protein